MNTPLTNAQIEALSEAFAEGHYDRTGTDTTSVLVLGIGTNNDLSVGWSLGFDWAQVVGVVTTYDQNHGYTSQVSVFGANDIESWGGMPAARDWWRAMPASIRPRI